MSLDLLLPLCAFAAVSSITPGPNNAMILASGLNYGFVRSMPHLFGICCGFSFMIFATGLGLHAVFEQFPLLQVILKYVGAIYLLWLAWKLAHAAPMSSEQASLSKPMGFLGAAAFQWINPKAWVMSLGALTTYLPSGLQGGRCGAAGRRVRRDRHFLRRFVGGVRRGDAPRAAGCALGADL
jgi:threonine/homoserine/homoserine lactone efflux protein